MAHTRSLSGCSVVVVFFLFYFYIYLYSRFSRSICCSFLALLSFQKTYIFFFHSHRASLFLFYSYAAQIFTPFIVSNNINKPTYTFNVFFFSLLLCCFWCQKRAGGSQQRIYTTRNEWKNEQNTKYEEVKVNKRKKEKILKKKIMKKKWRVVKRKTHNFTENHTNAANLTYHTIKVNEDNNAAPLQLKQSGILCTPLHPLPSTVLCAYW